MRFPFAVINKFKAYYSPPAFFATFAQWVKIIKNVSFYNIASEASYF